MTLSIDTTQTKKITVRLFEGNQKLDENIQESWFGSQIVIDMIAHLLHSHNCTLTNLSAIEVNIQAGSYTGTRVGVAIANALGYTLHIPVNGVVLPANIIEPIYEKK